jgi:hypothetical protein
MTLLLTLTCADRSESRHRPEIGLTDCGTRTRVGTARGMEDRKKMGVLVVLQFRFSGAFSRCVFVP